jgi:hypothetical protein
MMDRQVGYCTNVHAGANLAQTRANLQRYALAVKELVSPSSPMGVGLWLSAGAAGKLLADEQVEPFADWLAEVGLTPFTLNGFPFSDFHQPVVKHRVYEPNWFDRRRFDYTLDLITVLDGLLPASLEGSISTLPLAWGEPAPTDEQLGAAARCLRELAQRLARWEEQKGRLIYLCLEPEPGCVLQRSSDVVRFYEEHLLPGGDEAIARRHIRVCHDICHAAVMFEGQQEALECYASAGVQVGKVQVSSSVCAPLDRLAESDRDAALRQLAGFAEDRYLHQTMVKKDSQSQPRFYEDLSAALEQGADRSARTGEWRIHFHVPIHLERFGRLEGSQQQIRDCMRVALGRSELLHIEVETYAWGVLPVELRQPDLAAGLAQELQWLREAFPTLAVK